MKKVIYLALASLFLLSLTVELPINAQNRNGGPSPVVSNHQELDPGPGAERSRMIKECEKPDRPKPEVQRR
jgi:hypothetical protein